MSESGKDFPDWETLYKSQKIETMPWYNENFDSDLEKELDDRKIINDGKFLDLGPKNGFKILSEYNFHYATCKYCLGGFWPDQKTADHTLLIYSTDQPLSVVLAKLTKMVWNNVYI